MSPNEKKETLVKIRKLLAVIHSFKQPDFIVEQCRERLSKHVEKLKSDGMSVDEITHEATAKN